MALLCSFSWLSNVLLYICTTSSLGWMDFFILYVPGLDLWLAIMTNRTLQIMMWLLSLVLWNVTASVLTLSLSSSLHMLKPRLIFFRMTNSVEAALIYGTNTYHVSEAISYHRIPGDLLEGFPHMRDPWWDQQEICWTEHSLGCQPMAFWANTCMVFGATTFWDNLLGSFIPVKHFGPTRLQNVSRSSPSKNLCPKQMLFT